MTALRTGSATRWLLGAAALAILALGANPARKAFVRALVGRDGQVPTDMFLGTSAGPGLAPAARVRVVLIDGLGAAAASELPALSAVCAAGQELRIDVGFPTVSLPVQAALWTGRTQQQSGLQYRATQLAAPPPGASPAQVADSVALAESHPEIVRSFGFAATRPDPSRDPEDPEAWRAAFPEQAIAAVASPSRLVHVHVLRVDEAGHAAGAASSAYAEAVRGADELLGRLRAAGPKDALWFVLADHGHRPAGGHGGEEPEIRIVRGCVAGPGIAPSPTSASIHVVDLARAVADALGAELPSDARGRPWADALADPSPGVTLPRPGPVRVGVAGLLLALGLGLGVRADGTRKLWSRVPWALLLALLGLGVMFGWPSLSDPPVFAPRGLQLWLACVPAAVLALGLGLAGQSPRAQLAPALGSLAAALVLCRAPEAWLLPMLGVGEAGPPLMPRWSATVSVLFVVVRSLAEGVALAWVLGPLLRRLRSRTRA
ncbi:alkaline phosphatase family protein [Nannocystis bainbridge]|uniref:Alkaline phosphatase family protein n=1 Tax=Nannocystis bainbridge TaxID=2995303 RepID=A0ABT5E2G1_9BACT|nr:alkaline phosphatase family protein [Nannocystis bainbridge]MDC0719514.1 alkaline phosphatase family protein [Nannocystis bainbridge]